ncbi:hypothetical protein [Nocardia lasii]|uniref:Uncharacterized protein n=1 Tax=Nocardia lasii TaxID=1616107 RepID=A0ABW1JY44_9NOCA
MTISVNPRPLTFEERSVIDKLLQEEFLGARELRRQVGLVRVVGQLHEGSPTVDFRIEGDVPAAPIASGTAPVEANVYGENGELCGLILLWITSGMLAGIEYATYGAEAPTALPNADAMEVILRKYPS